jgi:glycosyltransferase involved in cell wall biosynthesis
LDLVLAVVMIALNTAWNLVNFRAGLIQKLVSEGHEVIAVAPPDEYAPRLAALGCRFVPLPMDNQGTHPGKDLALLWRFHRLLKRERPDVLLSYTVKPNIYGSLAAHGLRIPVINNIAGLGAMFIKKTWVTLLVKSLYRLALFKSARVFFQNEDDRALFVSEGLVSEAITDRLPGSGIDLKKFMPSPLPNQTTIRFLLIGRMLWDKGVGEYIQAARQLKQQGFNVDLCLLGFLDVKNPAAISRQQMDEWVKEGVVRYLGATDDVRPHIKDTDCIVLPSYREGTPRTLLEAAAMARPIVTTNAVGCREVVDDRVNGLLCQPRDWSDLTEKLKGIVNLTPDQRSAMGLLGRQKIEREFDEQIVIEKYLAAVREAVGNAGI